MAKHVPERYRRETPVDELGENLRIVGDALHMMSKELKQVNAELDEITRELEYIKLSPQRKLWQWFTNRWFVRRLRAWLRLFRY